jgi:hypothetical protein
MPETVRSIGFAAIAGSWPAYIGLGTAMTRPIRMFVLQNLTDAGIMISFDGINDHLPFPSYGYLVLDITSNKTIPAGFFLAEGQRLYIKQLTAVEIPTEGSVYVTTFYGAEL